MFIGLENCLYYRADEYLNDGKCLFSWKCSVLAYCLCVVDAMRDTKTKHHYTVRQEYGLTRKVRPVLSLEREYIHHHIAQVFF